MNFQEFWKELHVELRHKEKYPTLKRARLFKAAASDPTTINVTPSSKQVRLVTIGQFQGMWNLMKNDTRGQRYINTKTDPQDPGSKGRYYSYWNYSYICALIDHVVGDQDMK